MLSSPSARAPSSDDSNTSALEARDRLNFILMTALLLASRMQHFGKGKGAVTLKGRTTPSCAGGVTWTAEP